MNTNIKLVDHLINSGALYSNNIIEAFRNIDRIDFVPDSLYFDIYGDYPLQIGYGQTISQPTTVAMMLEMLEPKGGQDILDIGSGSGWTTALLSYIVKNNGYVIGLERIKELVEFGTKNLNKYHFTNAKIIQADKSLGIPNKKFDRILVSAAADTFPYELLEQLNNGGKLVVPVVNSIFEVFKSYDGEIEYTEHHGFMFVPLIK